MKKLFWRNEERDAVFEAAVRLFAADKLATGARVFQEAQNVLPADRRRKVDNSCLWRYRVFLETAREAAKTPTQEPPAPAPAPLAPPDPWKSLLDHILGRLAQEIADRIQLRLPEPAPAPVSAPTPAPAPAPAVRVKHDPAPAATATPPKPSVLIVGLLGSQAHQIKNSLSHRLEITCLTSEEALSRPALLKNHTILMTKFISHSTQSKYRRHPNLHMCNGGTTELAALLKQIG